MSEKKLNGKVALITGASRGLGKAMALALAEAGADLALVARDLEKLRTVAEEARARGATAEAFRADVTDEAQVEQLRREVIARFGRLHILINNAGMNLRKPLPEFTLAEWRQVMDTNVTSVFLMCRAFIPHLRGQGYGRIIQMTSTMSHVALPGRALYAASKTALLGLTRALALELAPEGITVNGISPGPFATDLNKPLLENPEVNRFFLDRIPLGHWGDPRDIGALAVFLCSEEAGFITGADLLIDGGWTAQ